MEGINFVDTIYRPEYRSCQSTDLRPERSKHHFEDDVFRLIFLNGNCNIFIPISKGRGLFLGNSNTDPWSVINSTWWTCQLQCIRVPTMHCGYYLTEKLNQMHSISWLVLTNIDIQLHHQKRYIITGIEHHKITRGVEFSMIKIDQLSAKFGLLSWWFPSLYVRGHNPLRGRVHPSITNDHHLWSLHKGYL